MQVSLHFSPAAKESNIRDVHVKALGRFHGAKYKPDDVSLSQPQNSFKTQRSRCRLILHLKRFKKVFFGF